MALLAMDRASVREKDRDERLHVEVANISKANVCPYYGREIPGWQELGLEAERVYQMLRDPVEIERAARTFNNIPILIEHTSVSASDPKMDIVVGTTGSDARFENPYLKCSLAIWTNEAIDLIEADEQRELSCGYYYTPDMNPGTFNGIDYDGIMRDIVANHVALVSVGRAGPDVVVGDESMKVHARLAKKIMALDGATGLDEAELIALLAADADPDEDKAEDEEEEAEKKAEDSDEDDDTAEDEESEEKAEDEEAEEKKGAMDSASLSKLIAAAERRAEQRGAKMAQDAARSLRIAEQEVSPLVGVLSNPPATAEAAYKLALDAKGVDLKGVHPSAYRSMVRLLVDTSAKPRVAMDGAMTKAASDSFAELYGSN